MPTVMRQPERSGWVPDWLEDFLARSPDLLLATTNIQTAPGAAAKAVAAPLARAILPKVSWRTFNAPRMANFLERQGVSKDMTQAILKKYPRTLGRAGHVEIHEAPRGSGTYETPRATSSRFGDVIISTPEGLTPQARQAEIEHTLGHELFGHGPQDVLGHLKTGIASGFDNRALRGDYLPPWVAQTITRFKHTPYFRRQSVPDVNARGIIRANLDQLRYESNPLELAANMRALKLKDLARQEAMERTGEPYIPGLGPRENITKVNQHRTDLLRNRLSQFRVSNPMDDDFARAIEGEQELDDFFFRLQEGLHKMQQPGLPLR